MEQQLPKQMQDLLNQDLLNNEQFQNFIKNEDFRPILSAGAIPSGHEGIYVPPSKELIEGAVLISKINLQHEEARVNIIEEAAKNIFKNQEELK